MKAAPAKPLLYGPTGKPISYGLLYPSRRLNPQGYRPRPMLPRQFRGQVTPWDRRELVDLSRQIFAQAGNLGTAIRDKNSWAFGDGWDVHYTGANVAWGEEATYFLTEQFFPNCDINGRHDWKTLLQLSGQAWDRDGDDLLLLTADSDGRFPKVEIIPGQRISDGPDEKVVKGGQYDGSEIHDGIIFDEQRRPIAARVVGQTPDEFIDYALGYGGNADLAFIPEWADQDRGIPLIARVSLDQLDLSDIDHFLKRGIKRASEVGLIAKTVEGEPTGNELMTEEQIILGDGTTGTVTYQEIGEGGDTYYFRSDQGEGLASLDFQNPHRNVEAFISRIERRGIAAVGWFYELLYLNESGRAATRLVCDLANQSIWRQQSLGYRRTWRVVRYALARAMKYGLLSRNSDPRDAYFEWEFGLPKQLSVDAGNDEQADRENLKMGTTSKAVIAQKKGYHWLALQRQRKQEILQNAQDAQEIADQSAGKITFDRAMELLEQRSPNPIAMQPGRGTQVSKV